MTRGYEETLPVLLDGVDVEPIPSERRGGRGCEDGPVGVGVWNLVDMVFRGPFENGLACFNIDLQDNGVKKP